MQDQLYIFYSQQNEYYKAFLSGALPLGPTWKS